MNYHKRNVYLNQVRVYKALKIFKKFLTDLEFTLSLSASEGLHDKHAKERW